MLACSKEKVLGSVKEAGYFIDSEECLQHKLASPGPENVCGTIQLFH